MKPTQTRFSLYTAVSFAIHVLLLAPVFVLYGTASQPHADIFDVNLVDAKPRLAQELKAEEKTPPHPEPTIELKPEPKADPPVMQAEQQPAPKDKPTEVPYEVKGGKVNLSYMQRLLLKIDHAWLYPRRAIALGQEGMVRVAFAIDRDGRLLNMRIVDGSGYRELDRAALKAIQEASPFARFTPDMPDNVVNLTWRFEYALDD